MCVCVCAWVCVLQLFFRKAKGVLVARVSDLAPGKMMDVKVNGRKILLVHVSAHCVVLCCVVGRWL